jgi:hypothetical protein
MSSRDPKVDLFVTSTCSGFVTRTINPNGTLQEKTAVVVISGPAGHEMADVYRRSGDAPGKWSLDRYTLRDGTWGPPQKERRKYDEPPLPPADAILEVVDGIQCWTMTPMTEDQRERVRELIRVPRSGT